MRVHVLDTQLMRSRAIARRADVARGVAQIVVESAEEKVEEESALGRREQERGGEGCWGDAADRARLGPAV